VAVARAGNLVIADSGSNRIRVVAARTRRFYGQAMRAGDIYTVAGGGRHGLGDGNPATKAQLSYPWGVAVDRAGNLVIADTFNNRVRAVAARTGRFYGLAMTAGDIYTVAGNGASQFYNDGGFSGDGGPATKAELSFLNGESIQGIVGVAIANAGNLFVTDSQNNQVRQVTG
jgi:DNA-binding beta-propeller fold protein YncE